MKRIIKCLLLGFVAMGFVACDSVSGMFDKFSYDEVFNEVIDRKWSFCAICKKTVFGTTDGTCGKFILPSELADEEKGLIGACEYTRKAWFSTNAFNLGYKNDEIKRECTTGQSEDYTGLRKVDKKSGTLLIENKYKVITIVESAEYSESKDGQGICKKREIYKLKRGQPKE